MTEGFVYKITPIDCEDDACYIGSTKSFKSRMAAHKSAAKRNMNTYLYEYINEKGGWDAFQKEILCQEEFKTRADMLLKERELMGEHENTINKNRPIITQEDKNNYIKGWLLRNTDYIANWKAAHPDYFKNYRQQYKLKRWTCICGAECSPYNKSNHVRKSKAHAKFMALKVIDEPTLE